MLTLRKIITIWKRRRAGITVVTGCVLAPVALFPVDVLMYAVVDVVLPNDFIYYLKMIIE
jgi:hypothetical protein